jgi:hypothetical protein
MFFFPLFFGWTVSHYGAQTGLECTIFLPQPPEFWDYKHAPSQLEIVLIKLLSLESICYAALNNQNFWAVSYMGVYTLPNVTGLDTGSEHLTVVTAIKICK